MNNDEKTMRQILTEVRAALEAANNDPSGPITDTIWMPPTRNETLFDFIDAALATPPSKVVAESVATPNLSVEEIACMGFDTLRVLQGKPTQRYSAEQIAQAIMQIVNGTWLPGGAPQVQSKIAQIVADALAERAVSPAEEAGSLPLKLAERIGLWAQYSGAWMALGGSKQLLEFYAAAHAEGRRSALGELEAKIEAAARDKDGNHVDDLRGWLDEAREENEVQGVAFHACSLKLKHAEEELAKEKERADRAEAKLHDVHAKANAWSIRAEKAEADAAMWAKRYSDAQAALAQPLQQEGGEEDRRHHEEPDGPNHPGHHDGHTCETMGQMLADFGSMRTTREEVVAAMHAPQPSDNLQQASTAQGEPAVDGEGESCYLRGVGCQMNTTGDPQNDCGECPLHTKESDSATNYVPEYKTLTDHSGRVTGVQWINASDAPAVGAAQATPEGAELIELAKQAGLWVQRHGVWMAIGGEAELRRFAELCRAAPPQKPDYSANSDHRIMQVDDNGMPM